MGYGQVSHRWALLALLALLLNACAIRAPEEPPALSWPQRQQQLQQLTGYQARGYVVYRTPQRTLYARFNYKQIAPAQFQWCLTHPLGQTLLRLEQQGSILQLQNHRGEVYQGLAAEQSLKALTGLTLPLPLLAHWLIGLPTLHDRYQLDAQQRLQQLTHTDDRFTVQGHYLAYRTYGSLSLPTQLRLTLDEQQILLKIDHWTLP